MLLRFAERISVPIQLPHTFQDANGTESYSVARKGWAHHTLGPDANLKTDTTKSLNSSKLRFFMNNQK